MQRHSKDKVRTQVLILDRTLGELFKIWRLNGMLLELNSDPEKNTK